MSKLIQDARKVVSRIVPTGTLYRVIWEVMKEKYQDRRRWGAHYLNNIFSSSNYAYSAGSSYSFVESFAASVVASLQLNVPYLGDFILLQCALRRLDSQSAQAFETLIAGVEFPFSEQLIKLFRGQLKILERSSQQYYTNLKGINSVNKHSGLAPRSIRVSGSCKSFVTTISASPAVCYPFCNSAGYIKLENCGKFKSLSSGQAQYDIIKSKNGCILCLCLSHAIGDCRLHDVCAKCRGRHYSLLHFTITLL